MKLTIRRAWRPRIHLARFAWRGWRTSALSLYWRRRLRRAPAAQGVRHSTSRRDVTPSTITMHRHHHATWTVVPANLVTRSTHWIARAVRREAIVQRLHHTDVHIQTVAAGTRQTRLQMAIRRVNAGALGGARRSAVRTVTRVTNRIRLQTHQVVRPAMSQIRSRRTAGRSVMPPSMVSRLPASLAGSKPRAVRISGPARRMPAGAPAVWSGVPTGRRARGTAPAVFRPSVPLQWRSPVWREPRAQTATLEPALHGPKSQPLAAAVVADTPPISRPAAPRAAVMSLDAPTIDRLTETVMQRLDRRLRIERERRGL